ncbi:MAG: DUF4175 family protein [Planctomycetota bacterium]
MAEGTISRPLASLERLRFLRVRRRRLRAWTGLFRWLVLGVLLLWLSFLLDWLLALPVGIRLIHLVGAGALLIAGFRLLLLSARTPVREDRLAAQVEAASGDLGQALITAVQLTAPDNPRAALYSPVLLARTVRESEERMANLHPGKLLSRRAVGSSLGLLALFLFPLLVGAGARPELASTYLKRNLFLQGVPWPKEYELEVLEPGQRTTLLAMGDSLPVAARRLRGGEARARIIVIHEERDDLPGGRENLPLDRKGEGGYRRVFRNVSRDFRFSISAGDYESEVYTVRVRSRPRVEKIDLTFDYPDYTGLDDLEEATANLGGHVKVPVGTVVSYRARTSIAVKSASWVETWRERGEKRSREEPIDVEERRILQGSFAADHDGYYSFRLVSEDGFENPNPIRYRIAVIPDAPPSIHILRPGRDREVSARARLPIELEAQDDYGVEEAALIFEAVTETDPPPPPRREPIAALSPGGPEGAASWLLDLEGWKPDEGSRIEYFAEALDAKGQRGMSRKFLLTIVSEQDLARILQDQLTLARERLDETADYQRETRRAVEKIADESRTAGTVPPEQAPEARHARMNQERINVRIDDSVERLQEIVDRARENRLTDLKDLPWIEGLKERLGKVAEELAPEALEALDTLARDASAGSARSPQVEEALRRVERTEKGLQEILDELKEWGDIRTIIRKMEELLSTERKLESQVKEKVKGRLGQ